MYDIYVKCMNQLKKKHTHTHIYIHIHEAVYLQIIDLTCTIWTLLIDKSLPGGSL